MKSKEQWTDMGFDEDRKGLKSNAIKVLKSHYGMLVAILLISMVIGAEFSGSLSILSSGSENGAGGSGIVTNRSVSGILIDQALEADQGDMDQIEKENIKEEKAN